MKDFVSLGVKGRLVAELQNTWPVDLEVLEGSGSLPHPNHKKDWLLEFSGVSSTCPFGHLLIYSIFLNKCQVLRSLGFDSNAKAMAQLARVWADSLLTTCHWLRVFVCRGSSCKWSGYLQSLMWTQQARKYRDNLNAMVKCAAGGQHCNWWCPAQHVRVDWKGMLSHALFGSCGSWQVQALGNTTTSWSSWMAQQREVGINLMSSQARGEVQNSCKCTYLYPVILYHVYHGRQGSYVPRRFGSRTGNQAQFAAAHRGGCRSCLWIHAQSMFSLVEDGSRPWFFSCVGIILINLVGTLLQYNIQLWWPLKCIVSFDITMLSRWMTTATTCAKLYLALQMLMPEQAEFTSFHTCSKSFLYEAHWPVLPLIL